MTAEGVQSVAGIAAFRSKTRGHRRSNRPLDDFKRYGGNCDPKSETAVCSARHAPESSRTPDTFGRQGSRVTGDTANVHLLTPPRQRWR